MERPTGGVCTFSKTANIGSLGKMAGFFYFLTFLLVKPNQKSEGKGVWLSVRVSFLSI
jgi:hypothetical protein